MILVPCACRGLLHVRVPRCAPATGPCSARHLGRSVRPRLASRPEPPRLLPDEAVTRPVLLLLLEAHPCALTEDDVIRELAGNDPGFAEADQIRRAVRDLERFGRARASATGVLMTRTAEHFARLMQDL